jgi:hypothetical protein
LLIVGGRVAAWAGSWYIVETITDTNRHVTKDDSSMRTGVGYFLEIGLQLTHMERNENEDG